MTAPPRRNGHRDKTLSTQAGDSELVIPELRTGSSFPSLPEPRCRIDQALCPVIMEAYVPQCGDALARDVSELHRRESVDGEAAARSSSPAAQLQSA